MNTPVWYCPSNCELGVILSHLLCFSKPFQIWIEYVNYFLFYILLVTETSI
jgi:hypothetical protein